MEKHKLGRPTWVEIDLDAITNNVNIFKKITGESVTIIGTLKGHGYGHGLVPIAKHLIQLGVPILAVGNLYEAIKLRNAGISVPVQVFGNTLPDSALEYAKYDLMPSFINEDDPKRYMNILGAAQKLKVWIKVETGLGRLGIPINKVIDTIEFIRKETPYIIEGIYTHIGKYTPSVKKKEYEQQFFRFSKLLKVIEEKGIKIPYKQFASTGATLNMPHTWLNCVAIGGGLFENTKIEDTRCDINLQNAFKGIKTKIISIKKFNKGCQIGNFILERDSLIGIAPIGVGDGFSNKNNNNSVIINGKRAFIRGSISFEHTKIDVTDIPNLNVGDEVTIIGKQHEERITIKDMCKRLELSRDEIITMMNPALVPFKFIKNNKIVDIEI